MKARTALIIGVCVGGGAVGIRGPDKVYIPPAREIEAAQHVSSTYLHRESVEPLIRSGDFRESMERLKDDNGRHSSNTDQPDKPAISATASFEREAVALEFGR